ncbi:MAG: BMC domain-containing protein [Christensenella sp.]
MKQSLGMVEIVSIPAGVQAGDAMLKAASVHLVTAQSVCAGKYIVMVTGDVAAVEASVKAGQKSAGGRLVDSIVISGVHEQVPMAVNACSEIGCAAALGVIETFSLCTAILVADTAVKAADIDLIEIRLGRGLGGKSFITLTGHVAAVEAAVKAAESVEEAEGLMSGSVVIPSPHPDMWKTLI